MREYNVGGSPVKNKLFIQSSLNEGFDFVSINIGIEEVLCALDDIVSDSDILKEEDYEFLANWLLKEYNDFITSYEIVSKEGLIKNKIETVEEIESHLNEGIKRTEKEHKKCILWLTEFMTANDMTLEELNDLCFKDSDWVFNQIFGE